MPDNAIEDDVDLEQQLLDLYQELSALRDIENEETKQDERFDELVARLKAKALNTIDHIRYLVVDKDRSNTDKACLILLLSLGFAGEVRANEETRQQPFAEPDQVSHPRTPSSAFSRKDL